MNSAPDFLALARPEVPPLPIYNAGLSSEAVRARYGVDRIARLGSNENPYGPSPRVAQALADLAQQVLWYSDSDSRALREAIAAQCGTTAPCVVVGNGSESILQMLCLALLSPGERVLTQRPAFGLHEIYPRMMGAEVELLDLTPALGFDVDAWCAALARGPKIAMLANPSNPVGCLFDSAAFARLLDATPAGTLLVVDEAYVEYARLTPGFPDALPMLRDWGGAWIALRTFSKAYGLAGLRVGYGIASDAALVELLDRVRTPFGVSLAAQLAARAALDDEAHMRAGVARTVAQREAMRSALVAMGLRVAPSATNFLFVDLGRPNGPVNEALLAAGVIVKAWKEPGFTQFLRISVGSEADNALCLQTLRAALAGQAADC
ncbi:MAG TPA: histidinol-phosphate transaminase [Pseudorhodoferax sp.]|nr:histidinol-phosphate transaminase [Pseudorhodoferax sp.]